MEITPKVIETITSLQKICVDVYLLVIHRICNGMSEMEIEGLVREEFRKRGIEDYWYDVPIFVLIGPERFKTISSKDYSLKTPNPSSILHNGDVVYFDFHPQDSKTGIWGDWNTMVVFQPGEDDKEQVEFLGEMQILLRSGIKQLQPHMVGGQIFRFYADYFQKHNISLLDKRDTVGHSMHLSLKKDASIVYLNEENTTQIGGGIFTNEPGGWRKKKDGDGMVVGRFEECVYVPKNGNARILGYQDILPVTI